MATLTTKVQDNFTDTNGTALASHTPDTDVEAGGWTDVTAGWEIQSNRANIGVGATVPESVIDAAAADVIITATVQDQSSGTMGLIGRYQDSNNFWLLRANTSANDLEIYDKIAGSFTLRTSVAITYTAADTFTLVATLLGDNIIIYDNTNDAGTYYESSALNTATEHGIRGSAASSDGDFDPFQIEDIEDNAGDSGGVAKLISIGGGLVG